MTVISVGFSVFMLLIDVLVSFIQAYVFTMLSTIFISFGQERGHDEGHDDGGHHHDKPKWLGPTDIMPLQCDFNARNNIKTTIKT